jgi:hypothetical protein
VLRGIVPRWIVRGELWTVNCARRISGEPSYVLYNLNCRFCSNFLNIFFEKLRNHNIKKDLKTENFKTDIKIHENSHMTITWSGVFICLSMMPPNCLKIQIACSRESYSFILSNASPHAWAGIRWHPDIISVCTLKKSSKNIADSSKPEANQRMTNVLFLKSTIFNTILWVKEITLASVRI